MAQQPQTDLPKSEPNSPKPESTSGNLAGNLATIVTLLIVSCYGIGYLILTLSDGAHGFLEFSLLKPRAVVTGAAFIFVCALPISLARFLAPLTNIEPVESKRERFARWIVRWATYCLMCSYAVVGCEPLFFDDLPAGPMTWSHSKGFMILFFLSMVSSIFLIAARRNYKRYPTICITIAIFYFAGFVIEIHSLWGSATIRSMVWVGALFLLTIEFLSDEKGFAEMARRHPLGVVTLVLAVIAIYSNQLFPFMKATWGGGSTQTATVYFSKDSPIDPGETAKAALIEVSDSGFYLVLEGSNTATYIPKPLVTAMEFHIPSPNADNRTKP